MSNVSDMTMLHKIILNLMNIRTVAIAACCYLFIQYTYNHALFAPGGKCFRVAIDYKLSHKLVHGYFVTVYMATATMHMIILL